MTRFPIEAYIEVDEEGGTAVASLFICARDLRPSTPHADSYIGRIKVCSSGGSSDPETVAEGALQKYALALFRLVGGAYESDFPA